MGQSSDGNYNSSYTGNEVDAAIGAVRNNKDSWDEAASVAASAASVASAAQSTASQALAKANANEQAIASMGGGMSDEVYNAIKANVNALRIWCNSLRTALANYAFEGGKPNAINEFSWPENESSGGGGSDTPTETPTLEVSPASLNLNSTVGTEVTKTFIVRGSNLTGAISLNVTGVFTLSGTNVTGGTGGAYSIASVVANGENTVTVHYVPTSAGIVRGSVSVSSASASSKTVSLQGLATGEVETGVNVDIDTSDLLHCYVSYAPTTVLSGGTATIIIAPENGYTLSGVTVIASATYGTVQQQSYDSVNDQISISVTGITHDTAITLEATAISTQPAPESYVTDGLVLHLDGLNQGDTDGEWKDSAPNVNRSFVLADRTGGNDLPTVLPNGVKFTSVNQVGYCNDPISISYTSGTIEVVFTPEPNFLAANRPFFVRNSSEKICAMFQMNGGYLVYGTYKSAGQTINAKRALVNTAFFDEATDEPLTVVVSQNKDMLVQNGVVNSSSPVGTRLAWEETYDMCIGSSTGVSGTAINPSFANATIHEIRIYNKKLTEADILQNQRYDNYRYNLGLNI